MLGLINPESKYLTTININDNLSTFKVIDLGCDDDYDIDI